MWEGIGVEIARRAPYEQTENTGSKIITHVETGIGGVK
jgi:hypothetical protein